MSTRVSRRTLVKRTGQLAAAAAAASCFELPRVLAERSPNSRLNIAGIGIAGRGGAHVTSSLEENLVAICDVVQRNLDSVLKRAERTYREKKLQRDVPKVFFDYREMFEQMGDKIDAVFVATPDHHHAPASMLAMKRGKHVYCEKPLTHSIDEARKLTLAARQHKVATQLGNQGRAGQGWRLLCEWIWAGAIGDVREVHVWTDRPGIPSRFWWPQGGPRPSGSVPIPEGLHWDLWLGPAPERPYLDTYKDGKFKGRNVYQPFVWRGWWDFGTGALGDIGCHAMSGIHTALRVEHAAAVELVKDSGDTTPEMYPSASVIRWEIPARAGMGPCRLFWYDGGLYPAREVGDLAAGEEYPSNGAILIGDRGKMRFHGDSPRLLPEAKMKDFKAPPHSIPRCESEHFAEWVTACKGGRAAFSNFDHAGPLTEFVLLGNLAIRAGKGQKVLWDGPNMKCPGRPDFDRFIHPEHRSGWSV